MKKITFLLAFIAFQFNYAQDTCATAATAVAGVTSVGTIDGTLDNTCGWTTAGTFNLTVTPNNSCGVGTSQTLQIVVASPLTADFTHVVNGYDVDFTDITTGGTVDSWFWDFGDGGSSTLENPMHTYTNTGTYNVILEVTNGCDTYQISYDVVISDPDGIAPTPEDAGIQVFASNGIAYLDFSDYTGNLSAEIMIFNVLGQSLWQGNHTTKNRLAIDLPNITTGIYIVSIRLDDKLYSKKVLLK